MMDDLNTLAGRDVDGMRAHADRLFERMIATPYGPKRKLLARQHIEKTSDVLRAQGWNEAIAALRAGAKP